MKKITIFLLAFWLLAAGNPPNWSEGTEPFQVAGPLYYVGTRGLGVYLIKTSDGLILVSGAVPKSDALIVQSIKKLGFKPEDVRLLLNSHAHFDHAGTTAALKKATGGKVVAMAADEGLLKSGGKTDYLFALRDDLHFDGVAPDLLVKDGEKVGLGGFELTAHATPGHTRGCTTWEMQLPVDGKTYDVVFADGTSVNPGTSFVKNPSYPDIADDYKRTFTVLESLRPDIFLSYHAEFFDLEGKKQRAAREGVKAWLDPDGYRQLIRKKKEIFENELQAQKR